MKHALFLALICTFSSDFAYASGCMQVRDTEIKFKRGKTCWEYSGNNTRYSGNFARGQSVTATMYGLAGFMSDKNTVEKKWEARDPSVSGPDQFFKSSEADDEPGTMKFVVPRTGRYVFEFSPCAMWGYYGEVKICAE